MPAGNVDRFDNKKGLAMDGVADFSETFDRVVVVNLARRRDRLERFWQTLGAWPFKTPRRFEAVDGEVVGTPAGWDKGPGAWGCLLSHRAVLDSAINDGVRALLVLEDDAYPVENFSTLAREFMGKVPDDWDGLMLGAEHLRPPEMVCPGVVRCVASNRSHAYAVRGRLMGVLSQFWRSTTNDHCDLVISSLMRHFKMYAPDPLLIGQDAGHSDVTNRKEWLRFLAPEQKESIGRSDPRHSIQRLVVTISAKRAAAPIAPRPLETPAGIYNYPRYPDRRAGSTECKSAP
jgi:glycosyl transferase family 25